MKNFYLRLIICLLCMPSGGILLLKTYGIAQMHNTTFYVFIPSLILLFIILILSGKKDPNTFKLIIVGAIGGLIGTFGYDLIRVPFMLMGSRIFAPINMYGMWICDSTIASEFTDTIGWLYHFSNGITFGIMYALFMKGRSFWWAIAYALLLETIFVISPFGDLFGLTSKPLSLAAAYIGHVAYGYPLGKIVQNLDGTVKNLKFFKKGLLTTTLIVVITILVMIFTFKTHANNDPIITFSDTTITPHIVRVTHGNSILIRNDMTSNAVSQILINGEIITLEPNQTLNKIINEPGIFQVKLKDHQRIKSIFILSEPVENFNKTN